MRKLILKIIVSVLIITGCNKNDELIQPFNLKMNWIESHEENTSGEIKIYRPGDFNDFQLSRYRQVFNFGDNNVCEYRVLAPNDAHYMAIGSWEYKHKTKILMIYNSDLQKIYDFELVELTNQVLKLKAN